MNGREVSLVACLFAVMPLLGCCGRPSAVASATGGATAAGTVMETASPTGRDLAPSPPTRFAASMAYDAASRTVVLFGGQASYSAGGQYLADTWLWDGHRWSQAHPAVSPPPRMAAAMAYDAANGTVVLFGGEGNVSPYQIGPLGDTWTWDGSTWSQRHPTTSPAARRSAALASYPPQRGVVLFGGDSSVGRVPNFVNEMWLWNGQTWSRLHTGPTPSVTTPAALVYDDAMASLVLYDFDRQGAGIWTWSDSGWMQRHPTVMPPLRDSGALGYDPLSRTVVLFGGEDLLRDPPYLSDTWTWDGLRWAKQKRAVHPPAVAWASMAYDGVSQRLLLFGGFGIASPGAQGEKSPPLDPTATWVWDGLSWTAALQH
jgi:hypothetical protein